MNMIYLLMIEHYMFYRRAALNHWKYRKYDGLNTLYGQYLVEDIQKKHLYTLIQVSLPNGLKSKEQWLPYMEKQKKKIKLQYAILGQT